MHVHLLKIRVYIFVEIHTKPSTSPPLCPNFQLLLGSSCEKISMAGKTFTYWVHTNFYHKEQRRLPLLRLRCNAYVKLKIARVQFHNTGIHALNYESAQTFFSGTGVYIVLLCSFFLGKNHHYSDSAADRKSFVFDEISPDYKHDTNW